MRLATPAALAGAADTAIFLAQRPQLFRDAPGRAAGSVVFGALWLGLAASSAADGEHPGAATMTLAAVVAAGSAAMLAVHLRHGIANPRVFTGASLGAAALADVVRRRL